MTTPQAEAPFDPSAYLEAVDTVLGPLPAGETLVSGGSLSHKDFSGLRDTHQEELVGLYDEHELAEIVALEQAKQTDPHLDIYQIDSIMQTAGDVSRASAILKSDQPDFVRLGELSGPQLSAVLGKIIESATQN